MSKGERLIDILTPKGGEPEESCQRHHSEILERAVCAAVGLRKVDPTSDAWAIGFSDAMIRPAIISSIEPIADVSDWLNFYEVRMPSVGEEGCEEGTNVVIVRLTDDSPAITNTDIAYFWYCEPQTADRVRLVSFVVARTADDWVEMDPLPRPEYTAEGAVDSQRPSMLDNIVNSLDVPITADELTQCMDALSNTYKAIAVARHRIRQS